VWGEKFVMLFSTLQTIELVAPVVHMSVFTSNTKKRHLSH
jgi:hypothetical protein